ncbi:MAG: PA14 domain-containing protein [Planctomycetota bacterium]
MTPALPPACDLVLRHIRPSDRTARVTVRLCGAGPDGGDLIVADHRGPLGALPDLAFMPLDFKALDVGTLARREYLLVADMAVDGGPAITANIPLMHPWAWEVFGPGRFIPNGEAGPLDADAEPPPGGRGAWLPFKDESWDHFGVMDFGLQVSGNSLHAPTYQTIYARIVIRVPATAAYLMKLQSDDQILVWLDGKEIYRYDDQRPVSRAAFSVPLRLEAGDHRLRIRVNQCEGRWQASLRIRTAADETSDVTGRPPEEGPGPGP